MLVLRNYKSLFCSRQPISLQKAAATHLNVVRISPNPSEKLINSLFDLFLKSVWYCLLLNLKIIFLSWVVTLNLCKLIKVFWHVLKANL